MNVLFTVILTVSDLERADEKYNDAKTKEMIKISSYRCNVSYFISVHKAFITYLFINDVISD